MAAVPAGVGERLDTFCRAQREQHGHVADRHRPLRRAVGGEGVVGARRTSRSRRRSAAAPRPAPRARCRPRPGSIVLSPNGRSAGASDSSAIGAVGDARAGSGATVTMHPQQLGSGHGQTPRRGAPRGDPAGDLRRGREARASPTPGRPTSPGHWASAPAWSSTTSTPRTRCSRPPSPTQRSATWPASTRPPHGPGSALGRLATILRMYAPEESGAGWPLWVDSWATALRSPEMAEVSQRLDVRWKDTVADVIRQGVEAGEMDLRRPQRRGVAHHRAARRPRRAGRPCTRAW